MARLVFGGQCGSPSREPPIGVLRTSPKSCPLSSRLASAASPSPRAALPKNCRRVSVTIASSKGCIEFSVPPRPLSFFFLLPLPRDRLLNSRTHGPCLFYEIRN